MSSLDATATAISRTHAPDLIPGYRLEKLVGAGGMGEVHKATQLSLGRLVAIKLLSPQLAQDETFVARFQKEAAALATLHHPHVVSILDKGSTDKTYYLVMEYVDGPSLRERMRAPPEDPQELLRVMLQICRAIEYAHHRGVIHRDLKPENILFDVQAGDLPKVTDFGLASFLEDTSARFALTSTHVAMGTLAYMAPEQRVDARSADGRADIFALGLIFYEMLVGELPAGHYDPPSRRKPGLDPRLDTLVANCLKQLPADRYPNVSALIRDLEPLAPHFTTVRPPKPSRLQRVKQGVRRVVRTSLQGLAALMVVSAAGVLGSAWLRNTQRPVPLPPGKALEALGPASVQYLRGRLSTVGGEPRKIVLGDGPDRPALLVSGRAPELQEGRIVFPAPQDTPRAGLMRVDVQGMRGDTARFTARVAAQAPAPTLGTRLRALVQGPPPDPETALLMMGSTGRYVALVHSGAGAPLRLEWNLGERRGTMLGMESPQGLVDLELEVDDEGELKAWQGTHGDRRLIAEPLHLGAHWQRRFGREPVPALGCLEGICLAENFQYAVTLPSPRASAQAPEPSRQEPPKQTPASTKKPVRPGPSRAKRSK